MKESPNKIQYGDEYTLNTIIDHYINNKKTHLPSRDEWGLGNYVHANDLLSKPIQKFDKKYALKHALLSAGAGAGIGAGVGALNGTKKSTVIGSAIGALGGVGISASKSIKEKKVLDDFNRRREKLPIVSKSDSDKMWDLTSTIWDKASKRNAMIKNWEKRKQAFDEAVANGTQKKYKDLSPEEKKRVDDLFNEQNKFVSSDKELQKYKDAWNDLFVSKINEKTASEELDSMYKQALMGSVGDSVMLGATIGDLTKKYNKAAGGMTGIARQKAGWGAVAGGIGKSVAKGAILGAGAQVAANAVDNITKPTQEDEYGRRVQASEVLDEMYKGVISYE